MYYRWRDTGRWLCPELEDYTQWNEEEELFDYYTHGGKALDKPLPEIVFQVSTFEGLRERDSLWAGMPYQVFSARLRQALVAAEVANIEYYPAFIQNRQTGEMISDYRIANIVGLASCMDWQASRYTPEVDLPGHVEEVTHLVLDPSKLPGHLHLFRLAEVSTVILCDQQVRDVLMERNIVGVELTPVETSSGTQYAAAR